MGPGEEIVLGGAEDALLFGGANRGKGLGHRGVGEATNFDKGEGIVLLGDDIDLSKGATVVAFEDAVALLFEEEGCGLFGVFSLGLAVRGHGCVSGDFEFELGTERRKRVLSRLRSCCDSGEFEFELGALGDAAKGAAVDGAGAVLLEGFEVFAGGIAFV